MTRLMLLLILAVWMIGAEAVREPRILITWRLGVFFGGYALLVGIVAVWARVLASRAMQDDGRLRRFSRSVHMARWVIPAWLLMGVVGGQGGSGWAPTVLRLTGVELHTPALLLGILPALLAWIGLWWAEYPAERALREQSILGELSYDLPVHMPPTFGRFFRTALRQQLLPIVAPVALIVAIRDVITLVAAGHIQPQYEDLVMLPAALLVYLVSPELLRWIFNARPLEESPLRQRLEEICRRNKLKYRDVLLWQTDHSIANAAVIGILPRWRYVLLSDRLLETMPDEQIEAVFAHELGHIVYHHMLWFVVFFAILTLAALGPGQWIDDWISSHLPAALRTDVMEQARAFLSACVVFATMLILFGMLSRRFERQADLFAARMMDDDWGSSAGARDAMARAVGERGAGLFSSALHRVAMVNNIPLRAKDWFHPSIANRMRYLEELSRDPRRSIEFDRFMSRLYVGMLAALLVCGAFLVL